MDRDQLTALAERIEAHGFRLARNADDGGQINCQLINASASCFSVAAALRAKASGGSDV